MRDVTRILVLMLFGLLALNVRTGATTFFVTNTNNSGPGSLREAITNANLNPGPNTVGFSNVTGVESDPVLRCTGVERQGDDIIVMFTTVSDRSYGLQYRSNSVSGEWVSLPASGQGSGGIVRVIVPGAAIFPKRFYRSQRY